MLTEQQLLRALTVVYFSSGIAIIAIFLWWFVDYETNVIKRAVAISNSHLAALSAARMRFLIADQYGVERRDKWNKELTNFIQDVLRAQLGAVAGWVITDARLDRRLRKQLEAEISRFETETPSLPVGATPIEYEIFCAKVLRQDGWTASLTKATGDQGADIVASKAAAKLVAQCKLYTKPVGNKAVQEIVAAKAYFAATHMAVVSNAGYTRAAYELANANGVMLLHHNQLRKLKLY